MTLSERIKSIDKKLTESTKDIKFSSSFPLLLYMITYALIDFWAFLTIFPSKSVPWELYLGRISISYILLGAVLFFFFKKKLSLILFGISSVFLLCYEFAQMCYSKANASLFRFSAISAAKEGMGFAGNILSSISLKVYAGYIGLLLFAGLVIFVTVKFSKEPSTKVPKVFKTVCCAVMLVCTLVYTTFLKPWIMSSGTMENYGSYDIYNYKNLVAPVDMFQTYDLLMLFNRDIVCTIKSNFISEDNSKYIDDYFAEKPKHNDNEMTGIFKGKNLVIFQLETFENQLITEDICPNLYKLREEGIDLTNFYSSRFGNTYTFGTELCVNTGLFAPAGSSIETVFVNNSFTYSLANQLKDRGYSANEFHFNGPDFYNRGVMHKVFGYDDYIRYEDHATNKDQNFELDDVIADDNGLYNKLIENRPFLDLIVSYSAHQPYNVNDPIYQEAIKRKPELAVDDESDINGIFRAKATITDDMIGKVIKRFEEDGLLDDTVFLIYGDHYNPLVKPDDISEEEYSNTPCFIYCKGIEPQKVEKYCCTNNILPTLANMFGFGTCDKYVGEDIFDPDFKGYAYFQNLAWIDKDYYFNGKEIVSNKTGKEPDMDRINDMNELVRRKIDVNNYILFLDYYKNK